MKNITKFHKKLNPELLWHLPDIPTAGQFRVLAETKDTG